MDSAYEAVPLTGYERVDDETLLLRAGPPINLLPIGVHSGVLGSARARAVISSACSRQVRRPAALIISPGTLPV